MIRPLRRRHLLLVGAMAAVVAPLYLAALAARPAPAVQQSLPAPLLEPPTATTGESVELPTTPPLRIRAAGQALELEADGFLEGADLLLYWTPAAAPSGLADAVLLGAVRGGERQRLPLPAAAGGEPGRLILYSLGHGEEVASTAWPPGAGGAP